MKKLLLLVMVLGLLVAIPLFATETPTGMGGLNWGASMQAYKDDLTHHNYEKNLYKTGNDYYGSKSRVKLGELEVKALYFFYNDKYYLFVAFAERYDYKYKDYLGIKELLISKYGQPLIIPLVLKINPNAKAGESCHWKPGDVQICLEINTIKGAWSLTYTYLPVFLEKEKAEKLYKRNKND